MIGHVYHRSLMADILDDLYVATCDPEIKNAVESFGGKVLMTQPTHERASDRVAEAVLKVEVEQKQKIDIVVMIQGDEPMLFPEMIGEAVRPLLEDESLAVSNLMAPIKTKEEYEDPNQVKVVVDRKNFAMYFSREPIPSQKKGVLCVPMFKQVCIIPFRSDFLSKFNTWSQTPLEIIESVDMLRILENGYKVKMVLTHYETYSVDTPEDLKKVERFLAKDLLAQCYQKPLSAP